MTSLGRYDWLKNAACSVGMSLVTSQGYKLAGCYFDGISFYSLLDYKTVIALASISGVGAVLYFGKNIIAKYTPDYIYDGAQQVKDTALKIGKYCLPKVLCGIGGLAAGGLSGVMKTIQNSVFMDAGYHWGINENPNSQIVELQTKTEALKLELESRKKAVSELNISAAKNAGLLEAAIRRAAEAEKKLEELKKLEPDRRRRVELSRREENQQELLRQIQTLKRENAVLKEENINLVPLAKIGGGYLKAQEEQKQQRQ